VASSSETAKSDFPQIIHILPSGIVASYILASNETVLRAVVSAVSINDRIAASEKNSRKYYTAPDVLSLFAADYVNAPILCRKSLIRPQVIGTAPLERSQPRASPQHVHSNAGGSYANVNPHSSVKAAASISFSGEDGFGTAARAFSLLRWVCAHILSSISKRANTFASAESLNMESS